MARYFVALLPPPAIQTVIDEIKHHFARHYHSRKALNSPPHITLQPPFDWPLAPAPDSDPGAQSASLSELKLSLGMFAAQQRSVPIHLAGFGAFAPRVIYVNVLKTPELLAIQTAVAQYFALLNGTQHLHRSTTNSDADSLLRCQNLKSTFRHYRVCH